MLFELPQELLDICVQHSDIATLRALRLTCRAFLPATTRKLFQNIMVNATDRSCERARCIMNHNWLRPQVQSITFKTSDYPWPPEEEVELPELYESVVHGVGRFENLQIVRLEFDTDCAGFEDDDDGVVPSKWVAETYAFRNTVMKMLVEDLNDPVHPATKVRCLSINNLQDMICQDVVDMKEFKAVLARLDVLVLHITTQYDNYQEDVPCYKPEFYEFFGRTFGPAWLVPVQDHLVSLTLSCKHYWGYFPPFDTRHLHFPNLKELALRKYTFAHDWQLEWILSHGETLAVLSFEDCPIVVECEMFCGYGLDRAAPPFLNYLDDMRSFRGPIETYTWKYETRWCDYLGRMKQRLIRLRNFSWNAEKPHGVSFQTGHQLSPDAVMYRYVVFACEAYYMPWVDLGDEPHLLHNNMATRADQYETKDQLALDELLYSVKTRRL